uniref:Cytochrome P450 n=1 Tax=Perinereis nuntia TaxID=460893 RepID=U3KVB4_PERNU|nr:cytochrome P450 [Perinereis nuntia]
MISASAVVIGLVLGPLVYVSVKIWKFMSDVKRLGRAAEQFPGDEKHWFWGHLHMFPGFSDAGLTKMREKTIEFPYGSRVWKGPFHVSITQRFPTGMRDALKTAESKPLGFGVYQFGRPWLGDGLIISHGAKHQRNRKLLTPAFHFDILKPYITVKNQATDILLGKLDKYADTGDSLEIFSNISLCTLDIILRCAFSYNDEIQEKGESHPYVQAVVELGDMWVSRTLRPWLYPDFIYYLTSEGRKFKKYCDFVHTVSEEIIKKRKETLAEKGEAAMKQGRYIDFLDTLLTAKDEDGKGLTDLEIRNEVDTFLFAGHDTTASGSAWTLYSLAEHPEHQEKCQEEIDQIMREKEDGSNYIEWEDLSKLKYLTMCIKEALRLHTPVPFIEREHTKDLEIDGKVLPPGSIVDVQIYNLHHNPVVWGEDNMEYKPSRFAPENVEKRDPYAFLPFSAGPRNCIGQNFALHEMKIIIARILQRFTVSLEPDHKVEKKIGVVMRTKDGIRCKVARRN